MISMPRFRCRDFVCFFDSEWRCFPLYLCINARFERTCYCWTLVLLLFFDVAYRCLLVKEVLKTVFACRQLMLLGGPIWRQSRLRHWIRSWEFIESQMETENRHVVQTDITTNNGWISNLYVVNVRTFRNERERNVLSWGGWFPAKNTRGKVWTIWGRWKIPVSPKKTNSVTIPTTVSRLEWYNGKAHWVS